MSDDNPYRDPREAHRLRAEQLREEREEHARFAETLRPRGSSRRRGVLALFLVMCAGGLLVFLLRTKPDTAVGAAAPASSPSARLDSLGCTRLGADYRAALSKAQACTQDDQCIAEARGQLMTGLDGCARFVTRSKELAVADERARQWQARGCANDYRTCAPPRGAICEAHVCVERPPFELPRSWHRVELPGVFSFLVPGDVVASALESEDSWVTHFGGKDFELTFDAQRGAGAELESESGAAETPPDAILVRSELLMLGGSRARLEITRSRGGDAGTPFQFSVWAPRVPSQTALGSRYGLGTVAISIRGPCSTKTSCDELVKVLDTFEAW